jgi:hypothetical protein
LSLNLILTGSWCALVQKNSGKREVREKTGATRENKREEKEKATTTGETKRELKEKTSIVAKTKLDLSHKIKYSIDSPATNIWLSVVVYATTVVHIYDCAVAL